MLYLNSKFTDVVGFVSRLIPTFQLADDYWMESIMISALLQLPSKMRHIDRKPKMVSMLIRHSLGNSSVTSRRSQVQDAEGLDGYLHTKPSRGIVFLGASDKIYSALTCTGTHIL